MTGDQEELDDFPIEDGIICPEGEEYKIFYLKKNDLLNYVIKHCPVDNYIELKNKIETYEDVMNLISNRRGVLHYSLFMNDFIGTYCHWMEHEIAAKARISPNVAKLLRSKIGYFLSNRSKIDYKLDALIENFLESRDADPVMTISYIEEFFKYCQFIQNSIEFYIDDKQSRLEALRVSEAAKLAITFWEEQTGRKFPNSLAAPANKAPEPSDRAAVRRANQSKTSRRYKSRGPAFVQGLFEILDPDLTFSNIDTGLRKAIAQKSKKNPKKTK